MWENTVNNKAKRIIWWQFLRRPELVLGVNYLHLSVCCSYIKVIRDVCLLSDMYNSRRSWFGNCSFPEDECKASVACVDCSSQSWRMGLTEMSVLYLADPFPTQKPQDCIVVGGGNHIHKLWKVWRWSSEEQKRTKMKICVTIIISSFGKRYTFGPTKNWNYPLKGPVHT